MYTKQLKNIIKLLTYINDSNTGVPKENSDEKFKWSPTSNWSMLLTSRAEPVHKPIYEKH